MFEEGFEAVAQHGPARQLDILLGGGGTEAAAPAGSDDQGYGGVSCHWAGRLEQVPRPGHAMSHYFHTPLVMLCAGRPQGAGRQSTGQEQGMFAEAFQQFRAVSIGMASAAAILLAGHDASAAAPKRLFVIFMENHSTEQILSNPQDAPYINSLIKQPGVLYATQYFGVTHPSLPNYLALFSGSTQGIWDDCKAGADVTCKPEEFVPDSGRPRDGGPASDRRTRPRGRPPGPSLQGQDLVDQLESKGHSWKAYMQSMPADNKTLEYAPVASDGTVIAKLYAQKHNPFMYFADVTTIPNAWTRSSPTISSPGSSWRQAARPGVDQPGPMP